MGTHTPVEERRVEDRRRQIMDAALPLFAQRGFKGTTNRDIAESAKIAPGLIYWYFKSKEELFKSIVQESDVFIRLQLPLETMSEVPPRQLLPLLARGIVRLSRESQSFEIMRIVVAETMHTPEESGRFEPLYRHFVAPLVGYFRAQISLNRLRQDDPVSMAQLFMTDLILFVLLNPLITNTIETPEQRDIRENECIRFVSDAFLRAFGV